MRIMKRSVLCCLLIMLLLALLGCREKGIDYEAYQKVLDEVILLQDGKVLRQAAVDELREETGESVDAYFRELYPRMIFRPPTTEDAPHRKRTARR